MDASTITEKSSERRGAARSLLARVDRRLLRSAVYTALTVLLVGTFKALEWLFEHAFSGAEKIGTPLALATAVAIGVVAQIWHKRIEEALAGWLNRAAHTREQALNDLAEEIPLVQDKAAALRRVAERFNYIFGIEGTALYIREGASGYRLAIHGGSSSIPGTVSADDPHVIYAALHRVPFAPTLPGSKINGSIVWPIVSGTDLVGLILLPFGERRESLDEFQIKAGTRVAEAVAYALHLPGRDGAIEPPLELAHKPSIAVLPFQNLSGDAEQEYFSDGMVEEIITGLSRFKSLFVIARNSTFTYKGRAVNVREVAHDLGVRYVLEGSVRKSGNSVRITGQLIDCTIAAHVWADHFDGTLEDIFALQDRVTMEVVSAIVPKVERLEIRRSEARPTEDLGAYDLYLRGCASIEQQTEQANHSAFELFLRAIEHDSAFAPAYVKAALCLSRRKTNSWTQDAKKEAEQALQLARRAIELAPDDASVLSTAGFVFGHVGDRMESGREMIDRALSLNPNLAEAWSFSAWTDVFLGRPERSLVHIDNAIRLSPLDLRLYSWLFVKAHALFALGRFAEAAQLAAESVRQQPNFLGALRLYAASSAMAGQAEEARSALARHENVASGLSLSNLRETVPRFRREEDWTRYFEAMRRAGMRE